MDDRRYDEGVKVLEQVMGKNGLEGLQSLGDVAPELSRYAIEAFGDLYGTKLLGVKLRELLTVAMLAALGTAPSQLKTHIRGAMNIGWSKEEIVAVCTHSYAYAGFPAALNAMSIAREVFEDGGQ